MLSSNFWSWIHTRLSSTLFFNNKNDNFETYSIFLWWLLFIIRVFHPVYSKSNYKEQCYVHNIFQEQLNWQIGKSFITQPVNNFPTPIVTIEFLLVLIGVLTCESFCDSRLVVLKHPWVWCQWQFICIPHYQVTTKPWETENIGIENLKLKQCIISRTRW